MFDIFKKDKSDHKKDDNLYINISALLIHVAKIDENYSEQEKNIIKKTLLELGLSNQDLDNVFKKSEEIEKNSNQILEFTKEVKNKNEEFKIKIVEALWKIIYADDVSDMYEASLMRRLTGLLYLDAKIVGDIKNKIKNELEASMILFYTGASRSSATIIDDQVTGMRSNKTDTIEGLHEIKNSSYKIKEFLLKGDIQKVASELKLSWEAKKKTSKSISNM